MSFLRTTREDAVAEKIPEIYFVTAQFINTQTATPGVATEHSNQKCTTLSFNEKLLILDSINNNYIYNKYFKI